MMVDLAKAINKWRRKREQVILMMDCNEDVRSERMKKFLDEVGMKDVIIDKHGEEKAPGTHIKGRVPIDGIFTTCAINIKSRGYTRFNQGVQGQRTDHRCLWIDIPTSALFGSKTPPIMRFQGRQIKSGHPKIAKLFNKKYKEFVIKNNLHQAIYQLEADVCFPITDEQRDRAEKIAKLRSEGIQYADKKCRRLF